MLFVIIIFPYLSLINDSVFRCFVMAQYFSPYFAISSGNIARRWNGTSARLTYRMGIVKSKIEHLPDVFIGIRSNTGNILLLSHNVSRSFSNNRFNFTTNTISVLFHQIHQLIVFLNSISHCYYCRNYSPYVSPTTRWLLTHDYLHPCLTAPMPL